MKKVKVYVVATNADYTVYANALSKEEAIMKAKKYYKTNYGEDRDDFEAYDLESWIKEEGGILEWWH